MVRYLALVSIAVSSLGLPGGAASADERTVRLNRFLCSAPVHSVRFANAKALGESDEIAKDQVGRVAKAEVCGRYTGVAAIESETIKLDGGVSYKLTAIRFKEDHKLAWLAETTFAPVHHAWDY